MDVESTPTPPEDPSGPTPATARPGGRPRDPALDDAIIRATRRRLVLDGFSAMTIADIATDAGVSRPTLYRRWPSKLALVVDALDYGLQAQLDSYPAQAILDLPPRDAFTEAVRRLDPCYANPDAIVLQGGFMGEHPRAPELLELLRERAVGPRLAQFQQVVDELRRRGHLRPDVDLDILATMCFGAFFGAFLRGDADGSALAEQIAVTTWNLITTEAARPAARPVAPRDTTSRARQRRRPESSPRER